MLFRLFLALLFTASATVPGLAKPKSSAPAKIDPQAKQLLAQMAVAYRSLRSYSSTLDVTDTWRGHVPQPLTHSEIVFQRPDQAIVTTTRADGTFDTQAVTDGKQLFVADAANPKIYLQQPASRGSLSNTLHQGVGPYMPPMEFMDGTNVLSTLYTPGPESGFSLTLGPQGQVNGIPVLTVTFRGRGGPQTFAIGKADHLLRRLIDVEHIEGRTLVRTVTLSHVMINIPLPASQFTFTPLPNAVPVHTFNELSQDPRKHVILNVGDQPPAFNTLTLNGQSISLDQYKGKVLLLDFWGTWCGPCREEIPSMVRLYRKYHAQGLDAVGFAQDSPQDETRVKAVVQKTGMTWRQVREENKGFGDIAISYGVGGIPYTVLIGRNGRIAAVNAHGKALEQAVVAALNAPLQP